MHGFVSGARNHVLTYLGARVLFSLGCTDVSRTMFRLLFPVGCSTPPWAENRRKKKKKKKGVYLVL
jgi:hypothetical protein